MEPPATPRPVPRPPHVKLAAEPPVGAGIILVQQTPEGAFAWATASTVTPGPATGTADEEAVAYLAALEAFLDHPQHVGRRLSLDVEDTPANLGLVSLIAEHLPHIPVIARSDFSAQDQRLVSSLRDALRARFAPPGDQGAPPARLKKKKKTVVAKPTTPRGPREPVRITAATATAPALGSSGIGWSWVTSTGRCKTGTFRAHRIVSVEVIVLLHLLATYRDADIINIGCHSKQALFTIQDIHSGKKSVKAVQQYLSLEHDRFQGMFDILVDHQATITFQLLDDNPRNLLGRSADRLAFHARNAAQGEVEPDQAPAIKAHIIDELLAAQQQRGRRTGDGSA